MLSRHQTPRATSRSLQLPPQHAKTVVPASRQPAANASRPEVMEEINEDGDTTISKDEFANIVDRLEACNALQEVPRCSHSAGSSKQTQAYNNNKLSLIYTATHDCTAINNTSQTQTKHKQTKSNELNCSSSNNNLHPQKSKPTSLNNV